MLFFVIIPLSCTNITESEPKIYNDEKNDHKIENTSLLESERTSGNDTEKINHEILEKEFKLGKSELLIQMVWIPEGTFIMGAPGSLGAGDDESPAHEVTIAKGFWMSKYEVTQKQWKAVKGNKFFTFPGDNKPAENISWFDVKTFIDTLNNNSIDNPWRMPTEAEWEYAARAGKYDTRFWYGNDNNYSLTNNYAWTNSNSNGITHDVGTTSENKSNPYGLWDMGGNVWEWCEDWYHWGYIDAPVDGSAWVIPKGEQRIIRGGSYFKSARQALPNLRSLAPPDGKAPTLGFRIVRNKEIMTGI